MTLFAEVILSLPLDRSFLYAVPEAFKKKVVKGARVLVPFKDRLLTGVVIERKKTSPPGLKLKAIRDVLDETPLFSPQFLSFTRQLSRAYYSSWGELLRIALPASFAPQSKTRVVITDEGRLALNANKISPLEKDILLLLAKKSYSDVFLKRKSKASRFSSLLSRLAEKGWVCVEKGMDSFHERRETGLQVTPVQLEMDFSLDKESLRTADMLAGEISKDTFSYQYVFGSAAKREAIYLYLIKKSISSGKRVLFLVPEIAFTGSLMEKFQNRLGEHAALLHSQMSESRREHEWLRINDGHVSVVAGPRSALFSPVENLGLVIVDEEQDDSYYQKENPAYDARQGAYLRAKQENALLIFGSMAPSVETYYEAQKRGTLHILEKESTKHRIDIVDDRQNRGIVSPKLQERLRENLDRKNPSLIFCNRRGYAGYVACSRCRYIPRCQNCDIALTYHKRENKLVCHYCDQALSPWHACPECGGQMVRKKEVGVEAVEEAVHRHFPKSRIVCFDTDIVKKKKDGQHILSEFKNGRIDILIGTQLLAHQKDLPEVSLVAVLFPETTLSLSDFRASLRTYQMINQMLGFLRSDKDSNGVIQTSFPEHFSIQSSPFGRYEEFYKEETKFRRLMNYPPYVHMVEVLFQGENLRALARKSREFTSSVRRGAAAIEILGPALTAARVRGMNRIQVILKAKRRKDLDDVLRPSLQKIKTRKSVRVYY